MPITDVTQLSNPETEMFRAFYNAVVSNIFTANWLFFNFINFVLI